MIADGGCTSTGQVASFRGNGPLAENDPMTTADWKRSSLPLLLLALAAGGCDVEETTPPSDPQTDLLSRPGAVEAADDRDETDSEASETSDEEADVLDQTQPEPTPELPPSEPASTTGFYAAYACQNDWEVIQGVGLTEAEALSSCLLMMAYQPGFSLRCTCDGRVIYDGCEEGAGTLPTSNDLYAGAFCDTGLFIQSYGISRGDALSNCLVNDALNPGRGVLCTYGSEVIYDGCGGSGALPGAVACDGWEAAPFARVPEFVDPNNWSADLMRCSGPTFRRFDARYGLWVGLVSCGAGYRFYLSEEAGGPYLPAADGAGHGQDLCELLNPDFVLPNEDDITSGDCSGCSIGSNYSFVGGEVYGRSAFGEPFTRAEAPAWGNYQSSVIACGVGPVECGLPTL